MARPRLIDYDLYVKTAHELQAAGTPVSVRNVQSRIGGSSSDILAYQRKWQSENTPRNIPPEISVNLRQAWQVELEGLEQRLTERYTHVLQDKEQQLKEAQELLEELEAKQASLAAQLHQEKEAAKDQQLALEKKLSSIEGHNQELQVQLEKLEASLKAAIIAQEASRLEAAKAQLQLERADEVAKKLEKENEKLKEEAKKLQTATHQAELRAAVAEAKLTNTKKA